ncbi:MAG: energy transducer TonB [Phycisphaerae bacterium]
MSDSPIHVVPPPAADSLCRPADSLVADGDTALIDGRHNLTALRNLGDSPDEIVPEQSGADSAVPLSAELSDLTWPHPLSAAEAAELAWLAETHRIIVLRLKQWVIPVSGLLSFLVAVLIEAALVAAVWWVLHWHPSGGGGGNMRSESGSSTAVGGIIQSVGLNSLPSNPAKRWRPGPLPAPPNLPNKPIWKPHTDALALLDNTNPFHAALPVIGINNAHNAWVAPSHILAPRTVHTQISLRDVPGQRTRGRGPQPNSRGPQPDAAVGGGGDGGTIQLFKHGAKTALGSAVGGGPGRGRGAGVGGGGSIVRPPPNPIMPLKYQFAWPAHLVNPKFQLTILPDGSVAAVKVLRSSGHPAIDQSIIDALMQARFLPNIIGGKPVESKFVIRYNLSS